MEVRFQSNNRAGENSSFFKKLRGWTNFLTFLHKVPNNFQPQKFCANNLFKYPLLLNFTMDKEEKIQESDQENGSDEITLAYSGLEMSKLAIVAN
jgi:hypothetical protein